MIKHFKIFLLLLLSVSCTNYGQLKITADLPVLLSEVSGVQYDAKRDAYWMLNDSGNKARVYLVSEAGKILRVLKVDAENRDWEDLAMDSKGNLYIGDFGNNANKRKDLRILKIAAQDLESTEKVSVKKIKFEYPDQKKFPPKKSKKFYDTEAFFIWNNTFYIFTKSRVKDQYGRTFVYKVANVKGKQQAVKIADYKIKEANHWDSSVTGADISSDGKKIALITHEAAWVFTDFNGDDFFSGTKTEYPFTFISQKESIAFKNAKTLMIADEERKTNGKKLYKLKIQ